MTSRSNKGTNQEAAVEPAAKGTAIDENGIANPNRDDSIQRAQAALNRLDFKSGVGICTEILDSNPLDPTQPLLLRSIGLERIGQVYEAAKDVEKALERKETRETHLRATFNFLALSLHHLEIAQQLPSQEDETVTSHLLESDLAELREETKKSKDRQLKSPFDRLSPELLVKTMSFSDSPSIAISTSICKSWNKSILETKSLFRHFEMEGKVSNIIKGLDVFGEKSSNSLKSIDLKMEEEVNPLEKEQLRTVLPSSGLYSLSIAHRKDLCPFIVEIASQCPSLTVLRSEHCWEFEEENEFEDEKEVYHSPLNETISFPSGWKPKLRKLIWNGGGESLVCDDALVDRLQEATHVTICSHEVKSSLIVKVLSSNASLEELNLPWVEGDEVQGMGSISFDLPHLEFLRLEHTPPSTEDADCSHFFKNFKAPKLRQLCLWKLNPTELSFIESESSPLILIVQSLLVEATEEAATSLIEAMKDWEYLTEIKLLLPLSTPSTFWNHFVRTMTILSREAVEGGYKDHFLFPKLDTIVLGSARKEYDEDNEEPTQSSISATALASMISSRLAVHRRLSHRDVFFSTAGDFDSSLLPPSGQDVAFASLQTSLVRRLLIYVPVTLEEKAISWLRDNVESLTS